MTSRPELILCDLDGTLVDSLGYLYEVYRLFLQRYGHEGSYAEFQALIGPPLREVVVILQERYGLSATSEQLYQVYIDLVQREYASHAPVAVGARSFLSRARQQGTRLMVVTSAPRALTEAFLARQSLSAFFEDLITAEDVVRGKPDPAPYLLALHRSGLPVSVAIAIEDSPGGVASASTAGLVTYWLTADGPIVPNQTLQVRRIGSWAALEEHLYADSPQPGKQ